MTWQDVALVAVILVFILPISIYISVKLGTYAYYEGKHRFQREQEVHDGDSEGEG